MDREIEKIFVDIIKAELNLPNNYGLDGDGNAIPTVIIDSQNIELGTTDELQISIGMSDAQVISNINRYDETTNTEIQECVQRENIQIDLSSRNNDARQRRWEIQLALKSILAQQMQEQYQFRIFRIPASFINASEAEGGSTLNRFSIVIPVNVWYRKEKTLTPRTINDTYYGDYYEEFNVRVDNEQSINQSSGIIEIEYE